MKKEDEIRARLDELDDKLRLIETRKNSEMEKPYNERDYRLLKFLANEQGVYRFCFLQLQWILCDKRII